MNLSTPILIFTDDKPGHKNQIKGLIQALNKTINIDPHWVTVTRWNQPLNKDVSVLQPKLIVCCGHKTHIPALLAKRKLKGKLVVLMRPSLPLGLFDLCIIPEHDNPPTRSNLITTIGVMNHIEASHQQKAEHGLILIGGPSKHHKWDSAQVKKQVASICHTQPNTHWKLTTSRRTPSEFNQLIVHEQPDNLEFHPYPDADAEWVKTQTRESAQIWVTEDSVSMIYESLTSGATVGKISLPKAQARNRVADSIERLTREGYLRTLDSAEPNNTTPPPLINQAQVAAKKMITLFGMKDDV